MIESLEGRELFSAGGTTVVGEPVIAVGPLPADEYAMYLKTSGGQQQKGQQQQSKSQSPKQASLLTTPVPQPSDPGDQTIRSWSNLGTDSNTHSTGGWLRGDLRDDGLW